MVARKQSPQAPNTVSKRTVRGVDAYAAQCEKCKKWRIIATEEEFEEIRSRMLEDPFVCDRKIGVSCEDPGDIEYNDSRTWVMDRPGMPKTPKGFRRRLVLRKDFTKLDAYYFTPTGRKLRSRNEIAAFLRTDPKYRDVPLSDFDFNSTKVMEDTKPEYAVRKFLAKRAGTKKLKISKNTD